jgi:hypothetical protein
VGVIGKGVIAQKAPDHGAQEKQKKTDDTGQYEKYWPGIGPHLLDFRNKTHQRISTETNVTKKTLLGVGIGVDRGDNHKPACHNGKSQCNRDRPLEGRPVANGKDRRRSHSGTSSQDNLRVRAAEEATPFRKEYSTKCNFATPSMPVKSKKTKVLHS